MPTLTEREVKLGYVRPLRTTVRHSVCGTVFDLSGAMGKTLARRPTYYTTLFCAKCQGVHNMHRPVGEFTWVPDGSVVGS